VDTTALIIEAASHAGALGSAMPDVLARSAAHFSATALTPETVQQFLATLKQTAGHLFVVPVDPRRATVAEDIPSWLSPSERMSRARAANPQPPVQRKPMPYIPSPEQLATLAGKSPAERMTLFRGWQAQATGA
jgi:hypothetical protein